MIPTDMSDIKIHRGHALPHDKARKEAEKFAKQLQDKFDLTYDWAGDRINFQRSGVSGFLDVGHDVIRLEVKLGMLLSFLKPTIESHITDNLDKVFEGDTATAKRPAKPAAKPAAKPVLKTAGSKPAPAAATKSAKKR